MSHSCGIVIPCHLGSTRFPGKPLAMVGGKPLLSYAVEAARGTGLPFVVATDYGPKEIGTPPPGFFNVRFLDAYDDGRERMEIFDFCFADKVAVVNTAHRTVRNGTERAAVANEQMKWDRVIVLQCDEPDVTAEDLQRLADYDDPCTVQTAMAESDWENDNSVAVLAGGEDYSVALRFVRGVASDTREDHDIGRHVGVYLYPSYMLIEYLNHPPTLAEQSHSLEQLRTMALGYAWSLMTIPGPLRSVNVPEDVNQFKEDGNTVSQPR